MRNAGQVGGSTLTATSTIGYTAAEKLVIAKRYLIPAAQQSTGVHANFLIEDEALDQLMRGYCRESGVRNLQKHIDKVRVSDPFCRCRFDRPRCLDLSQGGT